MDFTTKNVRIDIKNYLIYIFNVEITESKEKEKGILENKTTYIIVGIIAAIAFVIIAGVILFDDGKEKNTTNTSNNSMNTVENKEETDEDNYDYEATAEEQMSAPKEGETIAVMHVKNYGEITFKFFEEKAPKAVENFITHAKNGYYDGVKFHRVMEDFMIQGGDPKGDGTGGKSIWGEGFEEEIDTSLVPYRGALCMASAGTGTSTLGSQFFIVQAQADEVQAQNLKLYGYPQGLVNAYLKYGGYLSLYRSYTVFGQVISGMDVVDKIANTEKKMSNSGELSVPIEDIIIESIEIK